MKCEEFVKYPPDKPSILVLAGVAGVVLGLWQCGGRSVVIVHVEHVGQEGLGGLLLQVQLLHLVLEGGLVR